MSESGFSRAISASSSRLRSESTPAAHRLVKAFAGPTDKPRRRAGYRENVVEFQRDLAADKALSQARRAHAFLMTHLHVDQVDAVAIAAEIGRIQS